MAELPYTQTSIPSHMPDVYGFSASLLKWHIATCYCELAEEQEATAGDEGEEDRGKHRRVAIALSKYCAYLVVSVPELLPGPSARTKQAYDNVAPDAREALQGTKGSRKGKLEAMQKKPEGYPMVTVSVFWEGVALAKWLLGETPPPPGRERSRRDDCWKLLALVWVQTLLYAAPYGSMEAHMQHLSQGGEFITHLWALLFHTGILRWYPPPQQHGGQAGEGLPVEEQTTLQS